jgi:small subunit ribosomal protein S3Ae
MGENMAESMRELELKEKEREEKRKAKQEKGAQRQRKESAQQAKKWKGKDWFAIFSPRLFGEKVIGDTPTTNPKNLIGRNMEVGLSELTGRPGRDFYRIRLAVDRVDSKSAYTRFNGYVALKEHVTRIIRKRTQKIESIMYLDTKDKWRIQVTSMAILNRNTEMPVRKKVRAHMEESLKEMAANYTMDDFLRNMINLNIQKGIKKSGTKIYPVRFFEITKIEVKKAPERVEVPAKKE